jgi:butyryl-CoA dehydrogenase
VNFGFTEEQVMVQRMARDFAKNEVLPRAAEIDEKHEHPKDLVKRMAELGLLGVAVDDDYGGAGMDAVSYVLAMEEVSRACASTGVVMSVNNSLVCDPISKFGNEAQKKEWLVPLASGNKLGCFCLSEPDAGSDAAAQRTTAVRDGDHYVLNGTKNFITNGPVADVAVVMTMTAPEQGHKGITAFIVPLDLDGLTCGPADHKLGIRGSKSCQIFFDDTRVPASLRLGEEGEGFKVAMTTLDGGRIGIAAQALGIARACLEDSLQYAAERQTFGKPIIRHQAIQWKLADMATELDAARMVTLQAACLKDSGARFSKESAMAKLLAADVANRAAREAVQIFGGNGYVTEYPAERHFRDAKITEIYEGTSEIQRLVIAGWMFKE